MLAVTLLACHDNVQILKCEGEGCACADNSGCVITMCGPEEADEANDCIAKYNCLGGWPKAADEAARLSLAHEAACGGRDCAADRNVECPVEIEEVHAECRLGRCVSVLQLGDHG